MCACLIRILFFCLSPNTRFLHVLLTVLTSGMPELLELVLTSGTLDARCNFACLIYILPDGWSSSLWARLEFFSSLTGWVALKQGVGCRNFGKALTQNPVYIALIVSVRHVYLLGPKCTLLPCFRGIKPLYACFLHTSLWNLLMLWVSQWLLIRTNSSVVPTICNVQFYYTFCLDHLASCFLGNFTWAWCSLTAWDHILVTLLRMLTAK